jgi:hypothetical protein
VVIVVDMVHHNSFIGNFACLFISQFTDLLWFFEVRACLARHKTPKSVDYVPACIRESGYFDTVNLTILGLIFFDDLWIDKSFFDRRCESSIGWQLHTLIESTIIAILSDFAICLAIEIFWFDRWNVTDVARDLAICGDLLDVT